MTYSNQRLVDLGGDGVHQLRAFYDPGLNTELIGAQINNMLFDGLTHADARQGIELAGPQLERVMLKTGVFWQGQPSGPRKGARTSTALLLPNYDEYLVAYVDRSLMFAEADADKLDSRGNPIFQNTVLVDGRIVGTWRRTLKARSVAVAVALHRRLTQAERAAVDDALDRFSHHLGLPVTATFQGP